MSQPGLAGRQALAHPAGFLALGGGVGLAPVAPGTFGTLLGLPLWWLQPSGALAQGVVILVLFALGVWCCHRCAALMGVHDHPAIVFDEIVGFLITVWAVPLTWLSALAAFALFRLFDVWKPWPIRWVDRHVHGGLGIMLDDVLAGVPAAICLQGLWWLGWLS